MAQGAELLPDDRAQSVGADETIAVIGCRCRTVRRRRVHAVFCGGEAGELGPQRECDRFVLRDRVEEGALKIGAMDEKIGRAPACLGPLHRAEGRPRVAPSLRADEPPRSRGAPGRPREAARARRDGEGSRWHSGDKLQPGSGFLESWLALLVEGSPCQPARARGKARQQSPADPGAGDQCQRRSLIRAQRARAQAGSGTSAGW